MSSYVLHKVQGNHWHRCEDFPFDLPNASYPISSATSTLCFCDKKASLPAEIQRKRDGRLLQVPAAYGAALFYDIGVEGREVRQ